MTNDDTDKLSPEAIEARLTSIYGDEPIFVLRAQDILAPEIVREWAHRARVSKVNAQKVVDAQNIADAMEEWQVKKIPD